MRNTSLTKTNNTSLFSSLLIGFDYTIYLGVLMGIALAVPYMIMNNTMGGL